MHKEDSCVQVGKTYFWNSHLSTRCANKLVQKMSCTEGGGSTSFWGPDVAKL